MPVKSRCPCSRRVVGLVLYAAGIGALGFAVYGFMDGHEPVQTAEALRFAAEEFSHANRIDRRVWGKPGAKERGRG